MENKSFFRWLRFFVSITLFILLVSSSAGAQIVYPCAQNAEYPCKEVTPFVYIAGDTSLGLKGDDTSLQVSLPFPFTFYGTTYHTAWVSTNGFLSFVDSWPAVDNPPSYLPPFSASQPNGAIYAFWDDLVVNGEVLTKLQGTTPNQQFVIEWRNVTAYNAASFDFGIVLHETGAILLQYRNIDSGTFEMGTSATIGLENQGSTASSLLSHNRPAVRSPDFAVLFGKAAQNVPVDIEPRRCPNPVNLVSKGVFHVAILGTADVPVSSIDPNSVTLQGIAPLRWRLEDVGTPYEPFVGKTDIYHCNDSGRDGYPDLVFRFDIEDVVVGALGTTVAAQAGQALLLKLDGRLQDGTEIKGEDSVVIIRGHHKWEKERGSIRGHHKKLKEKDHQKKEKDKKDKDREDDDDD